MIKLQDSEKDPNLQDSNNALSDFEIATKRGLLDPGIDYDVKKSSASCWI
jgi:hypothetical protein